MSRLHDIPRLQHVIPPLGGRRDDQPAGDVGVVDDCSGEAREVLHKQPKTGSPAWATGCGWR